MIGEHSDCRRGVFEVVTPRQECFDNSAQLLVVSVLSLRWSRELFALECHWFLVTVRG
jgi:hypothetical protein